MVSINETWIWGIMYVERQQNPDGYPWSIGSWVFFVLDVQSGQYLVSPHDMLPWGLVFESRSFESLEEVLGSLLFGTQEVEEVPLWVDKIVRCLRFSFVAISGHQNLRWWMFLASSRPFYSPPISFASSCFNPSKIMENGLRPRYNDTKFLPSG